MLIASVLAAAALSAPAPAIVADPIPYGRGRRGQMAAYSKRHYGTASARLRPKVVVLHFTAGSTYRSAWETFASNDPNRGELPGTCAHFVVDKDGTIYQLVRLSLRCRHAIGVNHVALGIEMVQEQGAGSHWADQQILRRKPQIRAVLRLVRWLQESYGIANEDVIGHAMANDHRRFRDDEGWTNDHTDWLSQDVRAFRKRL